MVVHEFGCRRLSRRRQHRRKLCQSTDDPDNQAEEHDFFRLRLRRAAQLGTLSDKCLLEANVVRDARTETRLRGWGERTRTRKCRFTTRWAELLGFPEQFRTRDFFARTAKGLIGGAEPPLAQLRPAA